MTKTLNVRLDDELYNELKAFCAEIRIPASTLMASYAAQAVRDRQVTLSAPAPAQASTTGAVRARAQQALEDMWMKSGGAFPEGLDESQLIADIDEGVRAVRGRARL